MYAAVLHLEPGSEALRQMEASITWLVQNGLSVQLEPHVTVGVVHLLDEDVQPFAEELARGFLAFTAALEPVRTGLPTEKQDWTRTLLQPVKGEGEFECRLLNLKFQRMTSAGPAENFLAHVSNAYADANPQQRDQLRERLEASGLPVPNSAPITRLVLQRMADFSLEAVPSYKNAAVIELGRGLRTESAIHIDLAPKSAGPALSLP